MSRKETLNRGINKALFTAICNTCAGAPVWDEMGFHLIYLEEGKAAISMAAPPRFSTLQRRLHGGILATLADMVMSVACLTQGGTCRTVDLSMNYGAPAAEHSGIIAEGQVTSHGSALVVAEASIFDEQGQLIARGSGTYIGDTGFQPMASLF